MATNVSTNLLKWQVDQAALNKFSQDNAKAGAAQVAQAKRGADAAKEALAAQKVLQSGVDQFVAMAKRGELSLDQLRTALRDVARVGDAEIDKITQSLKDADTAAKQLQNTSEGGLITESGRTLLRGEREEGRFQSFALGTLGNIPGVGGSQAFGAASAAFDLVDALPNLGFALNAVKASVLENVAAIGIGGVGLVGVLGIGALALKAVTDAEAARGEAAKKTAEQLLSTAERVAGGATSADFRNRNAELERQRTVLQEGQAALEDYRESIRLANDSYGRGITTADEYRNALTVINANLNEATGGILGLKDGVGQSVSQVGDFNGVLEANQKNIDAASAAIAANNIALVSQAVEENDAAARRAERDQRLIASEQAYLAADQMTAEQRQQHIDEIQREVDSYQFLIDSGSLTAATISELIDRIRNLNVEQTAYKNTVQSTADILAEAEARTKALSDQTDVYFEALEIEGKAREALFAARQKEEDAAAASAQKILDIRADLAEKEAELWRKAGEDNVEAQVKAQESRLKQEQAYYKQVQEIQRRANTTITNAIFARDALAAYLAAQQKQEDLRKAKEDNDERLKQIDAALEEQQKVIAKRLQEQLTAQRKAADDAIRTESERRRKEAEINRRAIQEALVAYQNAAYNTQQIALYGSNGRRIIETQLWQDLNNIAVTWAFNTMNTVRSILGTGSGTSGSSSYPPLVTTGTGGMGGVPGFGAFHSGTPYVPRTGLYLLEEGEAVTTRRDNLMPDPRSGTSRGGATINLNFDGRTIVATSRQQALNVMGDVLDKAGIA